MMPSTTTKVPFVEGKTTFRLPGTVGALTSVTTVCSKSISRRMRFDASSMIFGRSMTKPGSVAAGTGIRFTSELTNVV